MTASIPLQAHGYADDGQERRLGTNPRNKDSDRDGIQDADDDRDGNGLADSDENKAVNAEAQQALRYADIAAQSHYVYGETYQGLQAAVLRQWDPQLSGYEPADTQIPGPTASPLDIWIGDGVSGADPRAGAVVLCSISRADTTYCHRMEPLSEGWVAFRGIGVADGVAETNRRSAWAKNHPYARVWDFSASR